MTIAKVPASSRSTERWENEGGPTHMPSLAVAGDIGSDLKRFGIAPVQLTVFDWNGYRYSNVKDAIAAAKRTQVIELPLSSSSASPKPPGETHVRGKG
jgi:hypothetical protein